MYVSMYSFRVSIKVIDVLFECVYITNNSMSSKRVFVTQKSRSAASLTCCESVFGWYRYEAAGRRDLQILLPMEHSTCGNRSYKFLAGAAVAQG